MGIKGTREMRRKFSRNKIAWSTRQPDIDIESRLILRAFINGIKLFSPIPHNWELIIDVSSKWNQSWNSGSTNSKYCLIFLDIKKGFISSTISFDASKILYIVIKSVWTVFLSLFFTFNYVLFTVKAILLQN